MFRHANIHSLIKSDLFTFRIGEEETVFVVHSHAVAATSDPFKALVNGTLAEATHRCATIREIRPDDFLRFIEYAYRRDYTIPPWTPNESSEMPDEDLSDPLVAPESPEVLAPNETQPWPEPEPEPEPVDNRGFPVANTWGSATGGKKSKKKSLSNSQKLRAVFQNLNYAAEGLLSSELFQHSTPYGNGDADQDFTSILLAYARMYTLAETYLVNPLKTLALHKLHQTLCQFQLYDRRVKDIVGLCRYACHNGYDRAEDGTLDRLRSLVVEYIAIEVASFQTHELFLNLMEEGGEFVRDFWVKVAKNML